MSEPRHVIAIWDLERADAEMHLHAFNKAHSHPNNALERAGIADRHRGRYVWILTDLRVYYSADIIDLESVMREMLVPEKLTEHTHVCLVGLSDTVRTIEAIVGEWRLVSDVPIDLELEPQRT